MNSRRCVSRFQFACVAAPYLFHYHRSLRSYHHTSGRSKEISQYKPKSAISHRTSLGLIDPLTLHAPQSGQSTSALETAERTANVSRCAGDCAYRRARRRARSTMTAMPCLSQYAVSPGNWCTSSTTLICSSATGAPSFPQTGSPAARSGKSSGISRHDRTRQVNKKPSSRMHARP